MLKDNLTKLRKTKGITRMDLAKLSGVSYRSLCYMEWGDARSPSIATVEKIAKALDVTVNDLIK